MLWDCMYGLNSVFRSMVLAGEYPHFGLARPKMWVLARLKRPKYVFWPDRTNQNMGIGRTEQTELSLSNT